MNLVLLSSHVNSELLLWMKFLMGFVFHADRFKQIFQSAVDSVIILCRFCSSDISDVFSMKL